MEELEQEIKELNDDIILKSLKLIIINLLCRCLLEISLQLLLFNCSLFDSRPSAVLVLSKIGIFLRLGVLAHRTARLLDELEVAMGFL